MKTIDINDLTEILEKKLSKTDAKSVADEIFDKLYLSKENVEEKPVRVGTLTKAQGFNGFHTMEIGTPVFELKGRYFIEQKSKSNGEIFRVFYYKESLSKVIKFD